MRFSINNSLHKLNLTSNIFSNSFPSINHAQQAQATSTPPPPQPSGPQAPDPPTPVVPQTTQAGPNPSFNPEEMMQQMKHTVESSIQAFVDKTQERNISQPPAPAHPPTPTYPQNISHSHHLGNTRNPFADPHEDPGPIAIDPCKGDMTNGQSP